MVKRPVIGHTYNSFRINQLGCPILERLDTSQADTVDTAIAVPTAKPLESTSYGWAHLLLSQSVNLRPPVRHSGS